LLGVNGQANPPRSAVSRRAAQPSRPLALPGKTFIAIDNVRGRIDSPKIESFLIEDSYHARAAFQPNTQIDPRRVYVMFTSNKADLTEDLANRSSCVRILKQPDGFQFPSYPAGQHPRPHPGQPAEVSRRRLRGRSSLARRQQAENSRNPPRLPRMARVLDWIVQNLLSQPPLMDGHHETLRRMTSRHLSWLRDVALAVIQQGRAGKWLLAADILDVIASSPSIEIPGHHDGADLLTVARRTNPGYR